MTRHVGGLIGLALFGAFILLRPGAARADCPWDNEDFLGPCGPTLVLPAWPTASWSGPEYYSTIQTGDIDGDGAAELVGRSPLGLELHRFNGTSGLWEPFLAEIDGTADSYVLPEFSDADDWDRPQYYSTIALADIDGDGDDEVVGRAAAGLTVWRYQPGSGGAGGSWLAPSGFGPLSDADGFNQPQYYETIRFANIDSDPAEELLVRAADGMQVYSWTGSAWQLLGSKGPFPDLNPVDGKPWWNNPQYYRTIQTADIDGDGASELLARGPDGMETYGWTGSSWRLLDQSIVFSDDAGWGLARYYETIQAADLDGDGGAELIGRSHLGMVTYGWADSGWSQLSADGPFPDSAGWGAAQYYLTIQTGDFDGDGKAELLARGAAGLSIYGFTGSGWSFRDNGPPQLADTYPSDNNGQPITVPLWQEAALYGTIQTADIDGDGTSELLARGPFGIRTWRLTTSDTPQWSRYLVYGYPDPAFADAGQQAAYEALGQALGVPDNDIRTNADNGYGNPDAVPPNTDNIKLWNRFLSQLEANCSGQLTDTPPSYASCALPSGSSGFTADDYTAVSNEIIAELFYLNQYFPFHDSLQNLKTKVWDTDLPELDAIAADLKLDELKDDTKGTSAYLDLFSGVVKALGAIATAVDPEVGIPMTVMGDLMGGAASGSELLGSSDQEFEQTYADDLQDLATIEETMTSVGTAQLSMLRGDLNLLLTVGGFVTPQAARPALWQIDTGAYESSARRAFAIWVYQTFSDLLKWKLVVATRCSDELDPLFTCYPPPDTPACDPTSDDVGACYLAEFSDSGRAFVGLLKADCVTTPNGRAGSDTECDFRESSGALPDQDKVNLMWGALTPSCSYAPGTGNAWVFDSCNLGLPTGKDAPDSDIFNNRNGWDFTVVNVQAPQSVQGQASLFTDNGGFRAAATIVTESPMKLRNVEPSLGKLLFERGGGGELALDPLGRRIDADVLLPTRRKWNWARFDSPPGHEPRLRLRLYRFGRQTLALLQVRGLTVREAELCSGVAPATDLWSSITLDDGLNEPVELDIVNEWNCRDKPNGDRKLRTPRPNPLDAAVLGLPLWLDGGTWFGDPREWNWNSKDGRHTWD